MISPHTLKEMEHFFQIYKDLEGTRVQIAGWEESAVALRETIESIARYRATFTRP
jgi:inorganic pyrophosphatase